MSRADKAALGLICAAGVAVAGAPARAADWWTILERPNFYVDTDADSLNCKGDVCSTWQRLSSPAKTVRVLVQFDCGKRLMRSLTQVYDRGAPPGKGAAVKLPANWAPVSAETMGAQALLFACSVREQHPPPRLSVMSLNGMWFSRAGPELMTTGTQAASPVPAPSVAASSVATPSPPPPALKPPLRLAERAPPKPLAPPVAVAPRPAPRPVVQPATPTARPSLASGAEVQISAGSEAASRAGLAALVKAEPALLAGHATDVKRKPGPGPEIYRAVIGGFASRDAAQAFCRKLTLSGRACFVRPPGG